MDVQAMIWETVKRIEEKLDKKVDREIVDEIDARVRKNENDILRAWTIVGVATSVATYFGWKS